jgi:hypothetical protein
MAEFDERYLNVSKHGVLNVPMTLWVGMLFLARHWILLIATLASRRSTETIQFAANSLSWLPLMLELPVLILIFAGFSRHPTAGAFLRQVWRFGRHILCLTAAVNIVWVGWLLWQSEVWRRWPELFLASCALLDVAIILGVYRSDYIKAIFAEFPEPLPVKNPAS